MTKVAQTQSPIHDIIARRWSPRAFADKPVESDKIISLLEAARWAASSSNVQPWSFIIATKDTPAAYDQLLQCLMEGNQIWAKDAPLLMLSVASLYRKPEKPNRHAFHDVGMASTQLVLQATAMDLYVHMMGGFHKDKAQKTFQIPDTHEPVAAFAMGYLGQPDQLPDKLKEQELADRVRKPLSEFVFTGGWGQTAPVITES